MARCELLRLPALLRGAGAIRGRSLHAQGRGAGPFIPTGGSWPELRALCRYDLGLGDDEIGALTPVELRCFIERMERRERRADARVARLCYVVASCTRAKVEPEMFMPGYEKPRQTIEDMVAIAKRWAAMHPGEPVN